MPEVTEEGLRDQIADIDLTSNLESISVEDRKTAFDARAELLLHELKETTDSKDISDEDKKEKYAEISKNIQTMKNEFLSIGMASLEDTKNNKIKELEQILAVYGVLINFAEVYEVNPEDTKLDELAAELVAVNTLETKEDGTKVYSVKILVDKDSIIDFIKSLKDNPVEILSTRAAQLQTMLQQHKDKVVNVSELLETITVDNIENKMTLASSSISLNWKKKTFASFCKKKIDNVNFHKSIKNDNEYFALVVNLFLGNMDEAITEEYVSDIFDIATTEGVTTKAEFIAYLRSSGAFVKIAVIAAIYLIEFVQQAFNDNTKRKAERFYYLSSLTSDAAYKEFRLSIIRAVYLTLNLVK